MTGSPDRGRTASGRQITDKLVDELVGKAEDGFDVDETLKRRGRPPLGSAPAVVESVRLEPRLRDELEKRARRDDEAKSSVIRKALSQYLGLS